MMEKKKQFRNFKRKPDDPFDALKILLSKFTWDTLRGISDETKLPISRLIGIAVDNELVKEKPFHYNCDFPETVYVPNAYAEEAGRILKLLEKFPKGVGIDGLTLMRWSIGIPDKISFLSGVRDLFLTKKIEFKCVKRGPFTHQFADDYEFIFLTKPLPKMTRQGNKKLDEMEEEGRVKDQEIAKLKAELAKRSNK